MFQFPGFAFITLCIQVINTWSTLLLAAPERSNNKVSGGLPHSEIHGSKPVLGSPWLIAEYHVLHRLLLPRHPPNALLALDLIQKKPGFFQGRRSFCVLRRPVRASCDARARSKAYIPAPPPGSCGGTLHGLSAMRVSVLDLDSHMPCGSVPPCPGAVRERVPEAVAAEPRSRGSRAHCPDQHDD